MTVMIAPASYRRAERFQTLQIGRKWVSDADLTDTSTQAAHRVLLALEVEILNLKGSGPYDLARHLALVSVTVAEKQRISRIIALEGQVTRIANLWIRAAMRKRQSDIPAKLEACGLFYDSELAKVRSQI